MPGARTPEEVGRAEEAFKLSACFQERTWTKRGQPPGGGADTEWDALAGAMTRIARLKCLALRTERSHLGWLQRFRGFTGEKGPAGLTPRDVERFPSHRATEKKVSASTQNQAFSALLFLYRHVLDQELGDMSTPVRAPGKRRLPVVLSQAEVRASRVLPPG